MNVVAAHVTTAVCTKVSTRLQVPQITGHQILTATTELTKTYQVQKGKNIECDDTHYPQILVHRTTAYLYITTSKILTTARCPCLLVA